MVSAIMCRNLNQIGQVVPELWPFKRFCRNSRNAKTFSTSIVTTYSRIFVENEQILRVGRGGIIFHSFCFRRKTTFGGFLRGHPHSLNKAHPKSRKGPFPSKTKLVKSDPISRHSQNLLVLYGNHEFFNER